MFSRLNSLSMSHSCCKTEFKAAADDPVASILLHLGCRTNWYGVIDAAVSLPLHSPRSASRIGLYRVTISRPCPFSSIHRWTDSAVHFVTGHWMRPETGRGLHPDLAAGRWTHLGDCLGSRSDVAAGFADRLGSARLSRPLSLAYSPDVFPIGRHAFWAGAGPGSPA